MSALRVTAAVVVAASFVPAAAADKTVPDVLANACGACHGTDGMSAGSIPPLQGLDAGEIETMLMSFKSPGLDEGADDSQFSTVGTERLFEFVTPAFIDQTKGHDAVPIAARRRFVST